MPMRNLSDKQIHILWNRANELNQEEIKNLRIELVKRGFASWQEINIQYYI